MNRQLRSSRPSSLPPQRAKADSALAPGHRDRSVRHSSAVCRCAGRPAAVAQRLDHQCIHQQLAHRGHLHRAGLGARHRLRPRPAQYLDRVQHLVSPQASATDFSMSDQSPNPLESASLAYENPAFLNSPDGRLIRIMAEYAEPLARFRRERIHDTVVFFGSARFHALDVANHELELLARPYGSEPAPQHEQPAKGAELDAAARPRRAEVPPRRGRRGDGALLRRRAQTGAPCSPSGP